MAVVIEGRENHYKSSGIQFILDHCSNIGDKKNGIQVIREKLIDELFQDVLQCLRKFKACSCKSLRHFMLCINQ